MISALLALAMVSDQIPDSVAAPDITRCRGEDAASNVSDAYSARWHVAEHSVRLMRAALKGNTQFLDRSVAGNVKLLTYDEDGLELPEETGVASFVDQIVNAKPVSYSFVSGRTDFSILNLCEKVDVLVTLLSADGGSGYDAYMTFYLGMLTEVELLPVNSGSGNILQAPNG